MIQSVSLSYTTAVRLAEVTALSSQSQVATHTSHFNPLLIHLDWAAQPALLQNVRICVYHPGSQWVNVRGGSYLQSPHKQRKVTQHFTK